MDCIAGVRTTHYQNNLKKKKFDYTNIKGYILTGVRTTHYQNNLKKKKSIIQTLRVTY